MDRLLGMIDRAVVGYEPFFDVKLVVFPEFAHAAPIYETRRGAAPTSWPCRSPTSTPTATLARPGSGGSTSRPGRSWKSTAMAGRGLQHHLPDRPRRPAEPLSQGQPLAALGGARQPPRSAGYDEPLFPVVETEIGRWARRSATTGSSPKRSGPWPWRGRGLDPRLGLHGPLGRDAAAGLVDAVQPGSGRRELRLRRRRQPGGEPRRIIRRSPGRAAA